MQSIYNELSIEIFKCIPNPINLLVSSRKWYNISQDPHARAEWLIYKYGRAHALFHAVRLGNSFITVEVIQALLSKNVILSRYFVQRMLMHFGKYDENLIDRLGELQKKLTSPWGSNISLVIFTKLITEGYNILNDPELAVKGNDMELFHFLSAGPLVINHAPDKLRQNLNLIKDLILKKKFVPFPPRPKPTYEDTVEYIQLIQARAHEEYPPKDGYENSRQLNVVARAILIHPDLVILWKEIGYREICSDVNELVMQGALLILFPPTPPNNWECPDVRTIVDRLKHLTELGFQLTDNVIEEIFHYFEHKLSEIGDLLMNSFQVIRKESKSDIVSSCLIQAIKPERKFKKTDLLEFLIKRVDNPKEALKNALDHHKVGFKFNAKFIKTTKEIRSLSVNSNLYYWILKNYGPNSEVTQKCFDDIIESRIWVDLKLQETPDREVPEGLTIGAFNSICSIYLEFCEEKVPFKANILQYLQLINNYEIINPFFTYCIWYTINRGITFDD
ncbi:6324_t:CDS:1 [Funneliformis mosseae]|uniref:6324_t:CDS:1 n=1 Tax=Funneliformis mosseae TaxID=27381 RepID=A0A9N9H465_FUNMO|nr:6324_t:CDS:1 [Funneliformis mosseae]